MIPKPECLLFISSFIQWNKDSFIYRTLLVTVAVILAVKSLICFTYIPNSYWLYYAETSNTSFCLWRLLHYVAIVIIISLLGTMFIGAMYALYGFSYCIGKSLMCFLFPAWNTATFLNRIYVLFCIHRMQLHWPAVIKWWLCNYAWFILIAKLYNNSFCDFNPQCLTLYGGNRINIANNA